MSVWPLTIVGGMGFCSGVSGKEQITWHFPEPYVGVRFLDYDKTEKKYKW